ncbi:helix-turn-helix domain-containing protein [Streptomyces sp. NPDC002446]
MATETAGFAHLLRRLKERSGRSYGVLAGQLHMSVSTLHRYCNGDAVPVDFAPAERFARLCGADREEMLELHRQWIVADEGRRRGRSASATAAAAAPATAAAAAAPTAPSRGAGSDDAAGTRALVEASATAAAEPDSAGSDSAESDSSSDDANGAEGAAASASDGLGSSPGAAEPAAAAAATSAPTTGAGPATRTSPASATSPARKRLRIALAALALVSLAVPAALALTLEGGTVDGTTRSNPRGAAHPPAVGDQPSAASRHSPAPGPSATKGSPARGGKGKPGPSASARSARPEASDANRPPAGEDGPDDRSAPGVGVTSYNWDEPCGVYYLMRQEPQHVPPPPAPQDTRGWASALGGIDGGHLRLQLTVTGSTDEAVVLTSLHVRVVGKRAGLPWAAYSMGDGCGGGITPQSFDIDLDAERPTAKPVAGMDGDIEVPAKDFPFKVSTHDPQVLNLDLHTEAHDVSWYLELGWSSGGRQGTLRVDDGGRPFRTSAVDGRERFTYWHNKHKWLPE